MFNSFIFKDIELLNIVPISTVLSFF